MDIKLLYKKLPKRKMMIFSMQFPTSDSRFLDLGHAALHAALALADLGKAGFDPWDEHGGG